MRFAAIDIGSNAVRCMIAEALPEYPLPTKLKLLRIPIRLGFDTFTTGAISQERGDNLVRTLQMFRLLMDIYGVDYFRACATSAFRDAANQTEWQERIRAATGIDIDIIDGQEEARIIFAARAYEHLPAGHAYLFIDVGGGSTDVTLFRDGEQASSQTFNIGTIRLLNDQVSTDDWHYMQDWLTAHISKVRKPVAVGSGGNINAIFQLSRKRKGSSLSRQYLEDFCQKINDLSIEERMIQYAMKPDRADVVGHACRIFTAIMQWGKMNKMLVPQVGLVDGMVKQLAEQYLLGNEPQANQ